MGKYLKYPSIKIRKFFSRGLWPLGDYASQTPLGQSCWPISSNSTYAILSIVDWPLYCSTDVDLWFGSSVQRKKIRFCFFFLISAMVCVGSSSDLPWFMLVIPTNLLWLRRLYSTVEWRGCMLLNSWRNIEASSWEGEKGERNKHNVLVVFVRLTLSGVNFLKFSIFKRRVIVKWTYVDITCINTHIRIIPCTLVGYAVH